MPITDLTWQQLLTALGIANAITVVNGRVMIDVGLVTGDTHDALSDSGVVEFMHKLREGCSSAQSTINNGIAVGQRLAAFPPSTATSPTNGFVTVTQQVVTRVPLNFSTITGPNS